MHDDISMELDTDTSFLRVNKAFFTNIIYNNYYKRFFIISNSKLIELL